MERVMGTFICLSKLGDANDSFTGTLTFTTAVGAGVGADIALTPIKGGTAFSMPNWISAVLDATFTKSWLHLSFLTLQKVKL